MHLQASINASRSAADVFEVVRMGDVWILQGYADLLVGPAVGRQDWQRRWVEFSTHASWIGDAFGPDDAPRSVHRKQTKLEGMAFAF